MTTASTVLSQRQFMRISSDGAMWEATARFRSQYCQVPGS